MWTPCPLERLPQVPGAFIQGLPGELLRIGPRVREADRDLKRAGADPDLRADRDVARASRVVRAGEVAVTVVKVDLQVGTLKIADRTAAEGADDAHPDVLLTHEQGRRVGVDDTAEVAFRARLPVRGCLHVKAHVGKLRAEVGGDEQGVLVRVGEDLLGQPVLVMGRVDLERRHPRAQPADAVLSVATVVDGWSAAGRGKKAELVQCYAVKKGKEDLAQRTVSERVPELAPGGGRGAERHLASGTPHRRCARSSWCFHRRLSMVRYCVRIESNAAAELLGEVAEWPKAPAC